MKNKYIKGAVMIGAAMMASEGIAANMETKIDGFLSTRYSVSDDPAFYLEHREDNGINEDGSFYGTKLGLNISTQVNEKMSVATQMIATIQEDGYAMALDWAFANLDLSPGLNLRVGKIKYPVGLVNEYVDVGVTYPWINAPSVVYSELSTGPQATRESFTGASLLMNKMVDDWTYGADLFAGQVDLTGMTIKSLVGLTVRANWDDIVELQASTYSGEMNADNPNMCNSVLQGMGGTCVQPDGGIANVGMGRAMDGNKHKATIVGVKADWNNFIAYSEFASVEMDAMNGMMDSDSWYATVGYRVNSWMPHVTVDDWEQESGYGQSSTTVGLNYSLSPKSVVKLEVSQVKSNRLTSVMMFTNAGVNSIGLFDSAPEDDSTQVISVALDTVF